MEQHLADSILTKLNTTNRNIGSRELSKLYDCSEMQIVFAVKLLNHVRPGLIEKRKMRFGMSKEQYNGHSHQDDNIRTFLAAGGITSHTEQIKADDKRLLEYEALEQENLKLEIKNSQRRELEQKRIRKLTGWGLSLAVSTLVIGIIKLFRSR